MGPIRGQTRPLPVAAGVMPEAQHIDAKLNTSIHNHFDVEVVDAETGEIHQRAKAENVVCNGWYKSILGKSNSNLLTCIAYGSGSGTPSSSDTALFAKIAQVTVTPGLVSQVNDTTWTYQCSITISETTSNGSTITEVGLCSADATILGSHAMLKDMNGNVISIAKTSTDIIKIYATIYLHLSNMNGWSMHGSTTDGLKAFIKAAMGTNMWIDRDVSTDYHSSSYFGDGTDSGVYTKTWSTDHKTLTIKVPRLTASAGNYSGGIKDIRIVGWYNTEQGFKTSLPASWYSGSDIIGEAIGTGDGSTTTFATDFIHATKATVYVNGVAASGVTVADASSVTNNIVFATAPASGAVVTADYHTSVIAKDANHVFDLTVTIQFGEHTT